MPNHVKTPERPFQFRKPLNLCVTVANQFTVKLPTAVVRPQPRLPLTKSAKEAGPSRPITVTVPLVLPKDQCAGAPSPCTSNCRSNAAH